MDIRHHNRTLWRGKTRNIATIPARDREAIIGKDFWVCYMLDYLFHRSARKENLAFKGGTGLSKAYGLIERFFEDIDLILDWRVLGYGINEPWEERSNMKQDIFNKEANTRAEEFLRDTFLPAISADLASELGGGVKCFIDPDDPQTVKISYPNSFADMSILQDIRLEIGHFRVDFCKGCCYYAIFRASVRQTLQATLN